MEKLIVIDMETGEQKEIRGSLTLAPEELTLAPEDLKQEMDMEFLEGFEATIEMKPLSALKMRWAFGIFPPGVPRRRIRRPEWRDL